MAKFNSKLSKKEIDEIFYQLCLAISEIKDPSEAAELLSDLLSYQESEMIAKRLKIAEYLINGSTYDEIEEQLLVSSSTIARVQEWLKISGNGYQKAVARTKKKTKSSSSGKYGSTCQNWGLIKRRFPSYYWPEILLENIVANASRRQKEKMRSVINSLEKSKEKTDLYYKIKKLIK